MNLSIIIPNFNGEDLLKRNIPKLLNELEGYKNGKLEVIVVDDGSTDNSIEVISKFPQIKLYKNSRNLGFSVAVNNGASHATGDILILINTDVYPDKGFLSPLLENFKDEEVFAVGCMDKSVEGENVVLRGRGVGSWNRGFLDHKKGEVDSKDTLWVSGGSGAFRKSIWDKLGGLDPLFTPFYWEDIDLSYRALKSGYKLVFEPKSVVWHEHEKGVIKKKFSPFQVKAIAFRNMFYFTWTNLTDKNLIIAHFFWLPYHFIKTLTKGEFTFYLGFFKAIINIPKVLYFRYNNSKLFVKTDKEITKNYIK
jgi:GT2 family glycosyltransferase